MDLFLLNAIINKILITIISCVLFILGYRTLNSSSRRRLGATEKITLAVSKIIKVEMDSVLPGTVFIISGLVIAVYLFSSPINEKVEKTYSGETSVRSGLGPSTALDAEKYREFSDALLVVDGVLSIPRNLVPDPDWEKLYNQKAAIKDMQNYFERKAKGQEVSK